LIHTTSTSPDFAGIEILKLFIVKKKLCGNAMDRPVIVWIRRDFRFHDNPAIFEAVSRGQPVLLLYVFDTTVEGALVEGGASRVWLERSLDCFGSQAAQRGFGWIIREGSPLDVLKTVFRETTATHLFWNRRYEPAGVKADGEIKEVLELEGVPVTTCRGNLLVEPWQLLNKKERPFQVFTPYWQAFEELRPDTSEAPEAYPAKPWAEPLLSLSPRQLPLCSRLARWPKRLFTEWQVGESHALEALEKFCTHGLHCYHIKRDFPGAEVTSRLSPYIHFGEISPRRVWNMVLDQTRRNSDQTSIIQADAFLRQLGWRDFAHSLLYHFPYIVEDSFREEFRKVAWRHNSNELKAWQRGHTGIPIVDAGMRQLWQTGWMHNRVRLITASFLVKHLLHQWQEGAAWFWDTLFDADLANNTFGWQWVAGCGIDPAPFFRIFNPVIQGQRFDPEGAYVRHYVPELCLLPNEFIHKPWEAPEEQLRSWNVTLGTTYPYPIVSLTEGRERALKLFSRL
jgi:deoxyribodipyrimidine photo-lyase